MWKHVRVYVVLVAHIYERFFGTIRRRQEVKIHFASAEMHVRAKKVWSTLCYVQYEASPRNTQFMMLSPEIPNLCIVPGLWKNI